MPTVRTDRAGPARSRFSSLPSLQCRCQGFHPPSATVFPIGEVVFGDGAREGWSVRGLELFDDKKVGNAILDQVIDLFADREWEVGDFAGAAAAGNGGENAGAECDAGGLGRGGS